MKFINIKWDMTYECNLNCRHCLNSKIRIGKQDLKYDQLCCALDKICDTDLISHIQLLGGEPTIHPHFCEVVTMLSERGIGIGVNTNCIKLDRVERVIEHFYEVNVSLEGPTRETHEYIRYLKQFSTFDRVLNNLKRLKQLKEENGHSFNLVISCVLARHNLPVIEDMVDVCADMGANGLNLLQLVEEGSATLINELQVTTREKMDAVRRVGTRAQDLGLSQNELKVNTRFTYNRVIDFLRKETGIDLPYTNHACGAGYTFGYMNQKAELYPCDRISPDYESVERNKTIERLSLVHKDFYDIWESDIYTDAFEMQCSAETYENCTPCDTCEYLQKTCYPCPAQVANNETPVTIEDCQLLEEL
jgi:MoaA/NifB/PqqE/SkfB family radical SAM enzyme